MKKKEQHPDDYTPSIGTIYDPYRISADDTFDDIYERYLKDSSRICEIDGLVYYKAAEIEKLSIHQDSLIVALPVEISPNSNCVLVDENGNMYEYRGSETMCFRRGIPEWYMKMVFAILSYPDGDIGEYFAKQTIL